MPRGAWQDRTVLALIGAKPTAAELYMWLHNITGQVSGLFVSAAVDLAQQLASLGGFDAKHIEGVLAELERRDLIRCEAGCFYILGSMRDVCAAPTSKNQIAPRVKLIWQLGPRLRPQVMSELLDVTARADLERSRRRKGVSEPIFEQLKRALGVVLCALPQEPADAQLSLPLFAAPEMRIVKTDDLEDPALCWLSLVEREQTTVKASCGAGHPPDVRPVGPEQSSLFFCPPFARGETTLSGTPFSPGASHEKDPIAPARRPLAAQGGHPAGAVFVQQNPHASGARTGVHPPGGGHGLLPARSGGQASNARAGTGAVSGGVRADADGEAEALTPLRRFIIKSRDGDRIARLLVGPSGEPDDKDEQMFNDAVKRHRATPADLDEMARLIGSGEEFKYLERGVAIDWLCRPVSWNNKTDRFKELLTKARTPARKPRARGGMPQPALSEHDDLDELFGPRRNAG